MTTERLAADPTTSVAASTPTTEATVLPTVQATAFMLSKTETGPAVVPVPRAIAAASEAEGVLAALLEGPSDQEVEARPHHRHP